MPKVIIYAPQGAGKTLHVQALMQHFGCSALIDEWHTGEPILENALALTNDESVFDRTDLANVYHLKEALLDLQNSTVNVDNNASLSV